MINILIVDDHQVIIDGLKSVLDDHPDFSVVGSAHNGQYALKMAKEVEPDVVLMDINMPVLDGLDCTKQITSEFTNVKVIALSMYSESRLVKRMIKLGAQGFLLKNSSSQKIEEAIRVVYDGGKFFDPKLIESVFEANKANSSFSQIDQLTSRELEVIKQICEESTTSEIAESLFISPHTVESHRSNIFSKLGLRNTAGLVKWAIKNGVVDI